MSERPAATLGKRQPLKITPAGHGPKMSEGYKPKPGAIDAKGHATFKSQAGATSQPTPTARKGATAGPLLAAAAIGRASSGVAKDSVSESGGVTAIMASAFVIIALAKWRGKANVDTKHALAGGLVALFGVTILYKLNPKIGVGFAVLILIMALQEYGEAALSGLMGGAGVKPGNSAYASAPQDSGAAAFVAEQTAALHGNPYPNQIPPGQGGLSDIAGQLK